MKITDIIIARQAFFAIIILSAIIVHFVHTNYIVHIYNKRIKGERSPIIYSRVVVSDGIMKAYILTFE